MPILPPSVNRSQRYFGVEQKSIRYGLGAIKGVVGPRVADAIAESRGKGEFSSLEDLCERLDSTLLNKTALEAMVQAGALDGLGRSRAGNFAAIEQALRSSAIAREDRRRGQKNVRGPRPADQGQQHGRRRSHRMARARSPGPREGVARFYLSGHPFEKRGAFLRRIAGQTTRSLARSARWHRCTSRAWSVRCVSCRSSRARTPAGEDGPLPARGSRRRR